MPAVTRYDVAELGRVETTPQGFIRAPAFLTRAGVLTYRRADGTVVRELRAPKEVFAPASLATLAAAPLTDLHPREMVSPKNVRRLAIGHVSDDVRRDGEHVAARVTVQDAAAIAAVQAGERRELSCGYSCELDETPGTFQGQPYDAVQRNIRYNHVGIGPKNWGRAGSSVALRLDAAAGSGNDDPPEMMRLDAADAVAAGRLDAPVAPDDDDDNAPPPDDDSDLDLELDVVLAERDALRAQVAALETQLDELGDQDALLAERDALRVQVAALQAQVAEARTDADGILGEMVQARAHLLTQARRVLPDWQPGKLSARQIHDHVLRHLDKRHDLSGETDDYVRSRFDAAMAKLEATPPTRGNTADDARRAVIQPASRRDSSVDVRAILEGRTHFDAPQLAYQPPPWCLPLTVSTERRR